MRAPKSWNDRGILEYEPLRSTFKARKAAEAPRRRSTKTEIFMNGPIATSLNAQEHWVEAVETWLVHAFEGDSITVDHDVMLFFVKVCWCLYNNNDLGAKNIILAERIRRGFQVSVRVSKSAETVRTPSTKPYADIKKDILTLKDGANISRTNSDINGKSFSVGPKPSAPSPTTSRTIKTTNPINSSASHILQKRALPNIRFKKIIKEEDFEPTLGPAPSMKSEIPSLGVRGLISSGQLELENPSHLPKKRRPSTSLDNREAKRHATTEMDISIETPMKRTVSVGIQKVQVVAGMPQTQRIPRPWKDQPPSNCRTSVPSLPMSNSRSSTAANIEEGVRILQGKTSISSASSVIPKLNYVPKVPSPSLTTSETTYPTISHASREDPTCSIPTELENPNNHQKKRASTSLETRGTKRRAITGMDAQTGGPMKGRESLEIQKIRTGLDMSRPKNQPQTKGQGIIISGLNDQEAQSRAIDIIGTPMERPIQRTVAAGNNVIPDLSQPEKGRGQPKKNRLPSSHTKAQTMSTALVWNAEAAPIIEKATCIKQEPADVYPTCPSEPCPSEPAFPLIPQVQAYEDEDRMLATPTELLCKEESNWIRPPEEEEGKTMVLLNELSEVDHNWIQPSLPNSLPHVSCHFPKSPLRILPPIWAESRQEICESFDWFRSYQGGVYHAHNAAKGYLLSAFPSGRDKFEHGGRLIISHGGGKAESLHCVKGKISSHPATDQLAQDKSVRALFDNYFHNRPLALLMDDKYALFPFDLRAQGIAYAVLGFYTIAHAWAEYQPANNESGRVVRYKFAFRWCEEQGPPWWHQEDEEFLATTIQPPQDEVLSLFDDECSPNKIPEDCMSECSTLPQALSETDVMVERRALAQDCIVCSRLSLRVFYLSWVCLNPDCQKFWRQRNGQYLPDHLDYHPDFLKLPPPKPIPVGFGNLEPASPLSFIPDGNVTNYAFSRGFHCRNCGRLSCRSKWECWECMNSDCQHTIKIQYPPRDANEFSYQTQSTSFKDHSISMISEINQLPPTSFVHECGRGIVHTFLLPHDGAKIHHIKTGNPLGRKEADRIFHDYQIQAASGDLKFRRWPMRAGLGFDDDRLSDLVFSAGEPYKYVGGDANTVPFQSAPEAVVKARALIQKRIKQALGISAEFNEVLSAAYMERQKMAFHSDNEVGLGPLVAGLSLGSPALMHFRLHAKHDPDREKRGILLSVVLRHGDVLVMDGAGVQEFYEHTVVPDNFRIAATARQINPGHA